MDLEPLPTVGRQAAAYHEPPHHVFVDSFSWLDEDDGLDLRLTLDDYHADPKPRPVTTTGPPSLFRRRLSVNKLSSFGRPSASSSRPDTKDSSTEQASVPAPSRRKSRALSLVTPKHGTQPSVTSIDATHYQDPDARHKLRAYLASPQKFDEALEYGFPADNDHSAMLSGTIPRRSRSFSRGLFMASSEKLKTFLTDDRSSIYSEETSIPDSESPRTPHTLESQPHSIKPFNPPSHSDVLASNLSAGCGQGLTASREMTLRMTLTRPDLRSREEEQYGWPYQMSSSQSRPLSRPFRVDSPVPDPEKDSAKENMNQLFADIDKELSSSSEGVVKRFWNRVRRN